MLSFLFEQEMTDNPKANAQCTLNDADREDQSSHNLNNQNTLRYDNHNQSLPNNREDYCSMRLSEEWSEEQARFILLFCVLCCALHA
jgi:hypothetical protein